MRAFRSLSPRRLSNPFPSPILNRGSSRRGFIGGPRRDAGFSIFGVLILILVIILVLVIIFYDIFLRIYNRLFGKTTVVREQFTQDSKDSKMDGGMENEEEALQDTDAEGCGGVMIAPAWAENNNQL